jgi:hypothetical protein
MKGDTSQAKFMDISHQVSPASLIGVSANNCQRALVDEPGMIIPQMGSHNSAENGCSTWGALHNTTP